jgi:hypothetical protein
MHFLSARPRASLLIAGSMRDDLVRQGLTVDLARSRSFSQLVAASNRLR